MSYSDKLQKNLSVEAVKNVENWLSESKYAEYRDELVEMIEGERWSELEDAFFKVIEFGTGGRRGTTGIGSNRINRVTIGESTQALCLYAAKADAEAPDRGIVIACDTRLSSPELSQYAASVAAANGFKTYLFDNFRSTPELSFAVRHLEAAVGIVISASHNPPADNGFKAYWSDGAQLVAPHDKGVLAMADDVTDIHDLDFDQAVLDGKISIIGEQIDQAYVKALLDQSESSSRQLKIAYSPLHGTGTTNVLPVLEAAGFTDVVVVEDQMIPDGNFPTVDNGKPNPEEKAANDRVVALMLSSDADVAISNDPDADRFGIMVRQDDQAIYLSGNQSAVLGVDFALRKLQQSTGVTGRHYIAKTIVTTDMMTAVADHYGATTYSNMLIGFKYIGELLRNKQDTDEVFVLGAEESYGMLKGDYARDKDGATGVLPLVEYAAELKAEGKTLWDRLLELYRQHGLYIERLDTMVCPGSQGFMQMQSIMNSLRSDPPQQIDNHQVTAIVDYQTLTRTDLATGKSSTVDCQAGNVFVLEFGDVRRRITVRPSGTEPKLKFYNQWHQPTANPEQDYQATMQEMENTSRELEGILLARVDQV